MIVPVNQIEPYIPNLLITLAVARAPKRPPTVKMAVMIEYRFEVIPRQSGRAEAERAFSGQVRLSLMKLSSEICHPSDDHPDDKLRAPRIMRSYNNTHSTKMSYQSTCVRLIRGKIDIGNAGGCHEILTL